MRSFASGLIAVVFCVVGGAAFAQDQGSGRWNGFYIGAHGGGGEGRLDGATKDLTGGVAGGHIGYNWQGSKVVLGIEADLDWSGYDVDINTNLFGFNVGASASTDFFTTLRGRIGFADGPVLIYGTFGLAYTEVDTSFSVTGPGINISQSNTTEVGGIVGGIGLEYLLGPNVSLRGEALWFEVHDDFDFNKAGYEGNVFRGGITYHFR